MVAKDGEHALKILFDEERTNALLPDLILLDWNLPKISGNEVLRRIKEHESSAARHRERTGSGGIEANRR